MLSKQSSYGQAETDLNGTLHKNEYAFNSPTQTHNFFVNNLPYIIQIITKIFTFVVSMI